jgi:phage tail-like protein
MSLIQKTSTPEPIAAPTLKPLNIKDEEIPIPIYQFNVEIDDVTVALFQNVTGMSFSREVEPLTVGGENDFGREFPGHVSYGHITFEVGLGSSDFFWKWMKAGDIGGYAVAKNFTLVQRRPQPDPDKASDPDKIFQVVKSWDFYNAFPVSWKISDLGIDNSQNIVIETLELSFDYFNMYEKPLILKVAESLKDRFKFSK